MILFQELYLFTVQLYYTERHVDFYISRQSCFSVLLTVLLLDTVPWINIGKNLVNPISAKTCLRYGFRKSCISSPGPYSAPALEITTRIRPEFLVREESEESLKLIPG